MKRSTAGALLMMFLAQLFAGAAAETASRSPENQVFQFMTTATFTPQGKPGLSAVTADAYLWIPPTCQRVRGVIVMAQNVPEHGLVGHPAIRAACSDCDLALLFTCRSFLMFNTFKNYPEDVRNREHGAFIQQILTALATQSGYAELATAPWFPMGESMALMVPNALTSGYPDRCIAGIQIKDGQWDRLKSPQVPMLVACGSGHEWDQPKHDYFTAWQAKATNDVQRHCAKRVAQPEWPGSLLIEGGSAHFSCTEAMAQLLAQYIRAACKARLPAAGDAALRAVQLDAGWVAGLSVPGATPLPPKRYSDCTPEEKKLPWYFDQASAQAAFDMAHINWNAQSSLPVFADAAGKPVPFNYRGITGPVPFTMEADGITFSLASRFLDQLPAGFVKAGAPLGHVAGAPRIEWLCGCFAPLGNNRFQLALDRTWKYSGCYVRIWHPGDATYRLCTNPGRLDFEPNTAGQPQKISFDAIPDQTVGVKEIQLHATTDAKLPVRYFVRVGPAEIHGDRLVFSPLPPRSKRPVTVTVAAWQWGRKSAPAVQTAEIVERSFQIK